MIDDFALLLNRSICRPDARKAKALRRGGATAMWFNSRRKPNADPRPQRYCNRALASAITAVTSSSACDLGSGWGSGVCDGGFLSLIFSDPPAWRAPTKGSRRPGTILVHYYYCIPAKFYFEKFDRCIYRRLYYI
jgi:hypothetical protein